MIDEAFIDGWVERLRRDVPGAVAIVLKGSHGRGNAGPWSDLDFDVLVFNEEIADAYLTWIVDDGSGRLVHVSVAVETVEDWLAGFREVASWSFGFPSSEVTRLLWLGRPSLRAELDRRAVGPTPVVSQSLRTSSRSLASPATPGCAATRLRCGSRSRRSPSSALPCSCR